MKRNYLIGLIIIILAGGGYAGYEILSDNGITITTDLLTTTVDTISTNDPTKSISVCSFNIQFLGHFKKKDNEALADLLKDYDIVVIQELVAPPYEGTYPDGETYSSDDEAQAFFDAMIDQGFDYILSEEDTGPGEDIHTKTSATEWWVAFYKDEVVDYATDLPNGFLAEDRSQNPNYDRVPYAFPFRADADTSIDFVLISVHLAPGASEMGRREQELDNIASWIDDNDENEKDFIILGDMNIEDSIELVAIIPEGYLSLNDECVRTNTLINDNPGQGAKPYDHVMYRPEYTSDEIHEVFDMKVLN